MTDIKATVTLMVDVSLRVDESVVDRMLSAEWQSHFYTLPDREQALRFLAYAMGVNNDRLSQMDGFADLPDEQGSAHVSNVSLFDVEYQ